jgi:hypothetical protein
MDYSLDGYCGLYCGACPNLLGTKAGTVPNACCGCKTDRTAEWCSTCRIKECARGKGLEFCDACAEYPCKDLEEFKTSAAYPYHQEVYGYMKIIREKGKAAWLETMKVRWSCPGCRREASWWDRTCKSCGAELNGYPKPA